MLIYIVRHGETNSNDEGRLQGWSNDHLNDNGVKLALITGQRMQNVKFDACISSPLNRARETAEIILRESNNNIEIEYDNRIKEINMGDWEHKKIRPGECEIDEEALKKFFYNPLTFPGCPNGENTEQVCNRTQEFLKELVSRDDNKTYLVVTHGCALRAMLNYLYDNPNDFWQGHIPYNVSVSIVEGLGGEAKIIEHDKIYYDKSDAEDKYDI